MADEKKVTSLSDALDRLWMTEVFLIAFAIAMLGSRLVPPVVMDLITTEIGDKPLPDGLAGFLTILAVLWFGYLIWYQVVEPLLVIMREAHILPAGLRAAWPMHQQALRDGVLFAVPIVVLLLPDWPPPGAFVIASGLYWLYKRRKRAAEAAIEASVQNFHSLRTT